LLLRLLLLLLRLLLLLLLVSHLTNPVNLFFPG
jgi:hypothetical protein